MELWASTRECDGESGDTACEIFSIGKILVIEGEASDVVVVDDKPNSNGDKDLETNDSLDASNSFAVCDFFGRLIDLSLWVLIYSCRYRFVSSGTPDRFWFWGSSKSIDCWQRGQYISSWR